MKALTQSGMREEVLDLYYRLDLSPFPIGDLWYWSVRNYVVAIYKYNMVESNLGTILQEL